MKFAPKTEEEIVSENLLPIGIYPFEVFEALDQVSKSNNEMIKLSIKVWDAEGGEHFLYDYLLESMAFKLRHAAAACGLLERYESGVLNAEDFVKKTGSLKVAIKKDKTGQYPDQNSVADYIVNSVPDTALPATVLDDEIPFGN
jgi:hypothetical protein